MTLPAPIATANSPYCYSCHWKREQLEEIEQRDNLKDFYVSLSKANKDNHQEKLKTHRQQYDTSEKDHQQIQGLEKWGTLDVLGQPAEPICTYYRCTNFHFKVQEIADVSIR